MSIRLHQLAALLHGSSSAYFVYKVINNPGPFSTIISRGYHDINGTIVNDRIYEYRLTGLLPVIPLLSCIQHISMFNKKRLEQVLKEKVNSYKWSEYSISAGMMLWAVASLSGVVELRSLIQISILNALLQYIGYQIDCEMAKPNHEGQERADYLVKIAWCVHVAIWVPIFISFFTQVTRSSKDIPDAVYSIIIVMFVFFSSFGLLQNYYVKQKGQYTYDKVETDFTILSLISKQFLNFMIVFGITRPKQEEDEEET